MSTPSKTNPPVSPADSELALARVDELASAAIDDTLTEAEAGELNTLLTELPAARERYLEAVQLHAELVNYFRSDAVGDASERQSPVVTLPGSFLGDGSGVGLPADG